MLALLIHLQLQEGRLYLWYGLTCLLAVISNLNILVTSPLIPFDPFDWVVFASRLAFTCLLGLTYLAYFKRDRPGYVRALLGYAVISPVLAWLFRLDPILISVLYLPLQLLGVTISVASLRWAWRSGTKSDWAMALTFLVVPVAGTLDLLRLRGGGSFTGVYVLVYSSALTLFLIGMGMISALAAALRTSRNLSSILQSRLDEREAELRSSHGRILEIEQQRARADERERLLRDMHDGFLSTLSITRVALASGKATVQQAAQHVNDCIDDLRLMLDSAARPAGVLEHLLVDYAHRVESRLCSARIEPSLEVRLEGFPELPSTSLLQIMRIVQEASNNALRHSRAGRLTIRALWDAETGLLRIEVEDDGQGLPDDSRLDGRGMRNMRARADALRGRLDIESATGGTRVRLMLDIKNGNPKVAERGT
ncbi:sensor histidine kinase [Quisquiliibacterium transsilvanicum]|uniref:Signal transduction histidine kinase n=1 Tax=Quisquiliibacterium transsilvanicum TaxID=1549638 RepID=A0A7W8M992_9BURK|nr:ATP-binding protein [Quisquiliibacterium transsilvanicum]MBB5272050.1 signal transduction histidine kinase [Quisquiliibacterium transsilvanicum]